MIGCVLRFWISVGVVVQARRCGGELGATWGRREPRETTRCHVRLADMLGWEGNVLFVNDNGWGKAYGKSDAALSARDLADNSLLEFFSSIN
ncbi:hypothetical protein IWZ03DRAFT_424457, partial [Phyllosticta citriasiana]